MFSYAVLELRGVCNSLHEACIKIRNSILSARGAGKLNMQVTAQDDVEYLFLPELAILLICELIERVKTAVLVS